MKRISLEKRFYSLFLYEFNHVGGEQKWNRTVGSFPNSYTVSLVCRTCAVRFNWLGPASGLSLDRFYTWMKRGSYERHKP